MALQRGASTDAMSSTAVADPVTVAVTALCNGIATKVACARALARVACPTCDVLGELPSEAVDSLKRRLTAWFAAFAVLARSPAAAAGSAAAGASTVGWSLQANGSASSAYANIEGADAGAGSAVVIAVMVSIIALVSLFAGAVVYLHVLRPLNERRARLGSGARATPTGSASDAGMDAEAAAIEDSIISSTRLGVDRIPVSHAMRSSNSSATTGTRRQALHVQRTSSRTVAGRSHEADAPLGSARSDRDPECDDAPDHADAALACDEDDPTGPPLPGGSNVHSAASSAGPQQLASTDACHANAHPQARQSRLRHGHGYGHGHSPVARQPMAGTRFATLQTYVSYSPSSQAAGRALAAHNASRLSIQRESSGGSSSHGTSSVAEGPRTFESRTIGSRLHVGPHNVATSSQPPLTQPVAVEGGLALQAGVGTGYGAAVGAGVGAHRYFESCDADETFPTAPTPTCSGAVPNTLSQSTAAGLCLDASGKAEAVSPRQVTAEADRPSGSQLRVSASSADSAATAGTAAACMLDGEPPLARAESASRSSAAGLAAAELSARGVGTRSVRTVTLELVSIATQAADIAAAETASADVAAQCVAELRAQVGGASGPLDAALM